KKDRKKTIKGEWVGVEKYIDDATVDTVYVFNGFLSYLPIQSDIKLYFASAFSKDVYKGKVESTRTAFLNLSETSHYAESYDENRDRNKNFILTENDLKKDTIRLTQNQRKKLINNLKI